MEKWTELEKAAWRGADKETITTLLELRELQRQVEFIEAKVDLILRFLGLEDDTPNMDPGECRRP